MIMKKNKKKTTTKKTTAIKKTPKVIDKFIEPKENLEEVKISVNGHPSHLADLDKMLDGFKGSNLYFIGSRPAMGKTALGLNIGIAMALKNNLETLFVTPDDINCLVSRITSNLSSVDTQKVITRLMDGLEYQRVVCATNIIQKNDKFCLCDGEGFRKFRNDVENNLNELIDILRNKQIKFLIVDHIEMFNSSIRDNEYYYMSRKAIENLKIIAIELNIPILILGQLTRKVDERTGHRPLISDVRCISAEEICDVLMFLLRREYYDPIDKPGLAELIIAKNRTGAIGSVYLTFIKEYSQFLNYKKAEYSPIDDFSLDDEIYKVLNPV